MFGLFNKNKTNITTVITKTSSQIQYEKDIEKQVYLQSITCPNCKRVNKNFRLTRFSQNYVGTNIHVVSSKCTKCNTEWDTKYKK
jgi:hypothetical protein